MKRALEFLMKYSEEQGYPFKLYNVTAENFAQIEAWFPGEFELEYDRDQADYVYESENWRLWQERSCTESEIILTNFRSFIQTGAMTTD